jgi:hypothetical protein
VDPDQWAGELAEQLLAAALPRRWNHSRGVGRKAEAVAHVAGDGAHLLICSAWLHDIGYSPAVQDTGLHSLDGARYLRNAGAAEEICSLVAYHSCADIEARNRGLGDVLADEFTPPNAALLDALIYCDMTTSPDGTPVEGRARLDEILERYPEGDVVARSIREATPRILAAEQRVMELLRQAG